MYGKTKLMAIMFSAELARNLASTGVVANIVDPGFNVTGLGRELPFAATLERVLRILRVGAPERGAGIISRLAVVLLGCWALYQAVYAQSILQKMLYAYTIYSAAVTPVVLAAFYSKRVTPWGAVAAIATGTVVTLAWDVPGVKTVFPPLLADRDAIFPALFAAVAAMILVSMVTPKPSAAQLAQFS